MITLSAPRGKRPLCRPPRLSPRYGTSSRIIKGSVRHPYCEYCFLELRATRCLSPWYLRHTASPQRKLAPSPTTPRDSKQLGKLSMVHKTPQILPGRTSKLNLPFNRQSPSAPAEKRTLTMPKRPAAQGASPRSERPSSRAPKRRKWEFRISH